MSAAGGCAAWEPRRRARCAACCAAPCAAQCSAAPCRARPLPGTRPRTPPRRPPPPLRLRCCTRSDGGQAKAAASELVWRHDPDFQEALEEAVAGADTARWMREEIVSRWAAAAWLPAAWLAAACSGCCLQRLLLLLLLLLLWWVRCLLTGAAGARLEVLRRRQPALSSLPRTFAPIPGLPARLKAAREYRFEYEAALASHHMAVAEQNRRAMRLDADMADAGAPASPVPCARRIKGRAGRGGRAGRAGAAHGRWGAALRWPRLPHARTARPHPRRRPTLHPSCPPACRGAGPAGRRPRRRRRVRCVPVQIVFVWMPAGTHALPAAPPDAAPSGRLPGAGPGRPLARLHLLPPMRSQS